MLPHRVRVDLGAMAMKGNSTFPQSSRITGTSTSDCLESYQDTRWGGLTPCREAVSIFYNYSWLDKAWLGWVLWHINQCRLLKAKSTLNMYFEYIWLGWVGFYGISTIVAYLIPNSLRIYWIYRILFGLVLWYISLRRLFNTNISL